MTKKEQFEKAMPEINFRRQKAILEQQRRREIVLKKVPQIGDLERELSQTTILLSKAILAQDGNASQTIQQIMYENLENQKKIEQLLVENGFSPDYLQIQYTCSKCEDTGFAKGKRCVCLNELMKKAAIEEFNASTSMSLSTFEDFRLSYYSASSKNGNGQSDFEIMSQILRFCQGYAATFSKKSASVLMLGGTGLGKTHLSLAIANEVLQQGYSVLYGSAQEFFSNMQNEHFGKGKPGEDTLATISEADLFILDDLGAEYESNFNASAFYQIINIRLNAGKPVIVNTNLTGREIETRYGSRVVSRLLSLYKTLRFVGTDIRQIKANII